MSNFYSAYKISDEDISHILEEFPPKYDTIKCDHITYKYRINHWNIPPYDVDATGHVYRMATIIGYGNNGCVEALLVKFADSYIKSDGNPFHITLSLNKSLASPKDSNTLEYQYLLFSSLNISTTPITLPC